MAKHNDNAFKERMRMQQKIEMTFREHLEKQLKNGIAQGMYAACKLISGKASDDTKTADERLAEILAFCEPVLKSRETGPVTVKAAET